MLLPAIGVASLLALLGGAIAAYRRGGERPAQWMLVGYVVVMLLWGTIAVTEQTVAFVRSRIPSTLGVAGG